MLKTSDVAREIGISPNTVREYVRRGWLNCSVTPTGMRLFDEGDVSSFKKNHMSKGVVGIEK